MKKLKALLAVKIISIDDGKRTVDQISDLDQRMRCTPGLRPASRHGKALRQLIDFLKCIFTICNFFDPVSDDLTEILLDVLTNDKNDLIETGLQRIMHGIVHDDLTRRTELRELLDAAAETGTDTRCHDHKCCLFHETPNQ